MLQSLLLADGEGKEESTTSVHEPCARVCMRDASALRGKVCPLPPRVSFLLLSPPSLPSPLDLTLRLFDAM